MKEKNIVKFDENNVDEFMKTLRLRFVEGGFDVMIPNSVQAFKDGKEFEKKRILKLLDDFKNKPNALKTKDIIDKNIIIADYFKWNELYDLIKDIKNQGDYDILQKGVKK